MGDMASHIIVRYMLESGRAPHDQGPSTDNTDNLENTNNMDNAENPDNPENTDKSDTVNQENLACRKIWRI